MNISNINNAFEFLKEANINNCTIEPKNDIMLLNFNLSIKFSLELMEIIDINDALKLIVKLKKENVQLKEKVNSLEERITKMDLNCEYNLFNVKSYSLENIYNNLMKGAGNILINTRAELGLINKGINHLFNENIIFFNIMYDSKKDGEEPEKFKEIYEDMIYSISAIKSKYHFNILL